MRKTTDHMNAVLEQSGYTYFAFISYRRTDARWAAWLKRRLQSYRLPQRTHRKHQELPPRFSAVFLDKTNLTPGPLDEGLREEVQASKFLIVICSRSAREKSQYLDDEIQYFLDGGGDASRIIPFIVDDAPRPEEECFPLRLQELCREQTILGANVHDSGKRSAFLKVIAYMHGLKLEEIESDEARRRRKRALIGALAGAAVLGGLAFGIWRYHDYVTPKTEYFQDYVERNGVPEGIGPIPEDLLPGVGARYAIVSSRNKVRQLRYENSHGQLIAHGGTADHDRPVCAVYEYAEDDGIDKVSWYDANGAPVAVLSYSNLQTVDLQFEQSDSYVGSAVLQAKNPLSGSTSGPLAGLNNVTRYLVDYDDSGFVTELRYVSNPAYNDVGVDEDGISGLRYERDELGRVTRQWYLTYTGERGSAEDSEDYRILGLKNGVSGMAYRYNESCELEEYGYLDADGAPIRNSRGFSVVKLTYDACHNPVETRFFDTEGRPVRRAEGYAVYAVDYDDRGDRVATRFLGTQDEPVSNSEGYASGVFSYDDRGNPLECSFFDTDGAPVLTIDGYAKLSMEYNEQDLQIRQSSFDTDGAPVLSTEGCASQSWEYDEAGRPIRTVYYGTDGARCLGADGCAEKLLELNEQGRLLRMDLFGVDGEPCPAMQGCCSFTQQFDKYGNRVELRYFGADGAPALSADGCAVERWVFDERGNPIKEQYFGVREEPVLCADGYAAVERTFDDRGNVTQARYLDAGGALVLIPGGYAMLRRSCDMRGNPTETAYYGTAETPVCCDEGYAIRKQRYDERGNPIWAGCYNTDGTPVLCAEGYSSLCYELDANGQVVKISCYGTDDAPIVAKNGYAFAVYEYDEAGRRVTEAYFDEKESLTACTAGYAMCKIFYDETGPIQADFYDTAGTYLGSQTDFDS